MVRRVVIEAEPGSGLPFLRAGLIYSAAVLEYAVARLVAVSEGLRGEDCETRAPEIVKKTGEAMRQFKVLAKGRRGLTWLMRDTVSGTSQVQDDLPGERIATCECVHYRRNRRRRMKILRRVPGLRSESAERYFTILRIRGGGGLWVSECVITYDGAPTYSVRHG